MIEITKTKTYGWESAVRGMRNPLNSWDKSDSQFNDFIEGISVPLAIPLIGQNDLGLMKRLRNAGSDHAKYLRYIQVTCDLNAPMYWWKEYDTYKVGTVANSCSTMHKLAAKKFEMSDFSTEHLEGESIPTMNHILWTLNRARDNFIKTKDKKYWWQMVQLLPTNYNQKRTVLLNYAVLRNMYHSRKSHKLDEWHTFCDWVKTLPYSELITEDGE